MDTANSAPWYKSAVIYELHVRSFCDSDGDGVGDFRGLREKLGYFEELGVTALWLLPFYPSPLRDDGYDIADYYSINPRYGTLEDFREFLADAHARGLRVITELVINHTSDQHPWFQRARRAPAGSSERNFYVWSETPSRFEEARIIFQDFESSNWAWDPVARSYFWHRFYSHQPDLNFDHPEVRQAVIDVLDFWLSLGVDGLRLDAIPYLIEREGTSCENLPETHDYLRLLRRHVDLRYPDRMLLAEANQWPEDAVSYFGKGDECHMEFHFPLMPRLFMSLQMEDRFPIIDILEQTPEIPQSCQWAIFLRNHDELTLEMVTDEERDYMYRIYAEDTRARINLGIRRRLAPLLANNRRKIELINSLLLSLPGTPIIYYGDELGMGDNFYLGDRDGVRTPMQWGPDRNAGFSRANPQKLFLPVIIDPEFHYETINVETQQRNLSSLFWWMRRILGIRKRMPAFALGSLEFLHPDNAKVLAYIRRHEGDAILVVANLSRFAQSVRIDLSQYSGYSMEELFGGTEFPPVGDAPTPFTLGPHGFYWLLLRPASSAGAAPSAEAAPVFSIQAEWTPDFRKLLESTVLPQFIRTCRWFGGKQRAIRELKIAGELALSEEAGAARLLLVELMFAEGASESLLLPLALRKESEVDVLSSSAVVARFANGALLDAIYTGEFRKDLLEMIETRRVLREERVQVAGVPADPPAGRIAQAGGASRVLSGEQSNTSIVYEDKWVLKFFRKLEEGSNPESEILRVFSEKGFSHAPAYGGQIQCTHLGTDSVAAVLASYVPNQGDGWTYTVDSISRFFDRVLEISSSAREQARIHEVIEAVYPPRARQLGERTGELHLCLASIDDRREFAPETFTALYRRSLYQTLRTLARRTQMDIARKLAHLPAGLQSEAQEFIDAGAKLIQTYSGLINRKYHATKMRVHGDFHLGQVLNTGKDFVIIDFEGEPRRGLHERLMKRSPLVDVASMLRSFDYAAAVALSRQLAEDVEGLLPWSREWVRSISNNFIDGYLAAVGDAPFLPRRHEDFKMLLDIFVLDKAIYEIGYELSYRPEFVHIPLRAALRLLSEPAGQHG